MATPENTLITEASLAEAWPSGAGSPQGVVFAAPGTVYVDTTSAVETARPVWIKRTAVSSATGWDLLNGTIRRNIASSFANVNPDATVHLVLAGSFNGLFFSNLKPVGSGVITILTGVISAYSTLDTFRTNMHVVRATATTGSDHVTMQLAPSGQIILLGVQAGDVLSGFVWWPRIKPIPAALIGTAV